MEFKKQKPIYLQIADTLCERVVNGEWKEGERIPSVRDVATELGVNPNTVLRTFEYLQNNEIIFNRRGIGYFLSDEAGQKILNIHRKEFIEDELPYLLAKMRLLGITMADIEAVSKTLK